MPTVGQITDKVSELRSKIAVTESLITHLKVNYLPSNDRRPAEMHFVRSDFGRVPAEHVTLTIADFEDILDSFRIELRRWEELPVTELPLQEGAKTTKSDPDEAEEGKKSSKKSKTDSTPETAKAEIVGSTPKPLRTKDTDAAQSADQNGPPPRHAPARKTG